MGILQRAGGLFALIITLTLRVNSVASTPPSWGNGLQLALAASDINTADPNQVTQVGGVFYVKDWFDPTTGQHATQSVASKRPYYVQNALGGQPALQFDGVSNFLSTTLPQITGDKSIFIVEKRANPGLTTELSSTTGTSGMFFSCDNWSGYRETEGRLNVAHDLFCAGASINTFILKSYIRSGPTGTLRVNNATTATGSVPDVASGNYTISGASNYFFQGQIAEILIYNRSVSDTERRSIEKYLSDKYSLAVQSPPIVNGLQLRLAADTIDSKNLQQVVQLNGSTYVKTWVDTSGGLHHAVQSATGKQPALIPNYVNGRPALQFSGKAEFLSTTLPQISGDKTIFVVQKRVGTQLGTELSSTLGTAGMSLSNVGGAAIESEGRLPANPDLQLPGNINKFILKSYLRSGTAGTLMVNDSQVSSAAPDSASGNYSISDSTSLFSGFIAEILIYNRALTESERQATENYLSEKYALWDVPLSIQSGLQLWLRADASELNQFYKNLQGSVSGTNYYVSTWLDSSPGGKNATQSAIGYQPRYVPNAQNGRPVLRFDGAYDYLTTNLPQIVGDKTLFVVHNRANNWQLATEISSTARTSGMFLGDDPFSGFSESEGRLYVAHDIEIPSIANSFHVKSFIRNGSIGTLRVDNTVANAAVPDSANGSYTISGLPFPFIGDIAEVLIYNRAVTDPERQTIEDYLSDKWSYPKETISSVVPDLGPPTMTIQAPGAGLRVKATPPEYSQSYAYHALYLPVDWQPGRKYPVIVEYVGNGSNVQDSTLGYGISGGSGFIWICMPTIGGTPLSNQPWWWGDINATKDYCLKALRHVCEDYGGDPSAVILVGHSRGGIACNYIGLSDDTIADAWLAFVPHSGYDGQYSWGYAGDDTASAFARLQRLKGRTQHISQDTAETSPWNYLRSTGIDLTPLTFRTFPYSDHTDQWALRPIQLRRDTRAWLQQVLASRPGTHAINGRVTDAAGNGIAGVRIQSGYTHFTFTDATGIFQLAGLIDSSRTVTATAPNYSFPVRNVTVSGADVQGVNFAP